MKLYSYWRSTTSYRVRIALNLKSVAFETMPIDLTADTQRSAAYTAINPGQGVPTLILDDATAICQSMAIVDWLDAAFPKPPLLPSDPIARAQVQTAAQVITTDIHPINNLRVVNRLKAMGHQPKEIVKWMNDWMTRGFRSFDAMIDPNTPFCFGETPGLADLCLVPQLYNAHRWGCDLASFSRLVEIERQCMTHPAFDAARPENQPDAN